MNHATKILVRGPNWLGDLVMATPGFRALRAAFPSGHIVLQVRAGLESVLDGAPWFDEVIPVHSHRRGLSAMASEARELRRLCHFDLGICIPDSFSSALLMRMAGVRRIVGYAGGLRGPLLHQRVPVPPSWGRRRLVARERFVLGLMEAVGCEEQGTHLELFVTDDEQEKADAALKKAGLDDDVAGPLLLLAPGASFGPSKWWPATRFAEVGDDAVDAGAQVVVVGDASELELGRAVSSAMTRPVANLVGALDLGTFKALIGKATALVCNDAGARHLAVAFGVPSAVLMGPTSLRKTPMNLSTVRIFETDVSCRPCYQRECPIDHRCMNRLEAADVISFTRNILERRSGQSVIR